MKQGLTKEQRLQRLQRRRSLRAFGLREGRAEPNVSLFSSQLGLTGKLDLLIHQGLSRLPVEIKFTQGPAQLNHRLQLAGYALLLESEFGIPVPYGYIVRLPDDAVDKILIDEPLRELTWKTIEAVRITIHEERMPPPTPRLSRCRDCEYLQFCDDVQ